MKKALIIVAAVATYSLIETSLLLSSVSSLPGFSYPSRYQTIVWWGQFLSIPGLAALVSRIMYGSYRWRSRTLTILLVGTTGPYQRIQQFDDLSDAYIECSGGRRFHAGFFGIRGQVTAFYEMLGRIAPVK